MIQLFNEIEYTNAKSLNELPCQCRECNKIFYLTKYRIQHALNPNTTNSGDYCSNICSTAKKKNIVKVVCTNCGLDFKKYPNEIKKSKSGNHFCCQSCSTTYNNVHKTTGNRRSKLERWLESRLITQYPNLEIHFNRKDTINSELDIYIPSLKLAFELNGIFHYEPIYGQDKLNQIQNNDNRKFQACIENGIEFCSIDTSTLINFKEHKAIKYLLIITKIINDKKM